MAVGGCFCGNVRVEYSGQPIKTGLCHCNDCRKLTGALFSYSFIVKNDDLKVTGNTKPIAKISDTGNHIKNYFCPECGTQVYGKSTSPDGVVSPTTVLRAGIFDDLEFLNEHKPEGELFVGGRVNWLTPIEGAMEFPGMLPPPPKD